MSNFRPLCLRCTLLRRQRTRDHMSRWVLYGELLATWLIIRHLSSTAKNRFLCLFLRRERGHLLHPSGPRPADHGRGQGRVPPQSLSWQTGSSHNPIVMPINDSSDPWLDQTLNCWPQLEEQYAEVFAVRASFKTDDPPLWSGFFSPSACTDALRGNRGLCLNCHEDNHSFKHCRHSFINASGCLSPELGQLGDDDAYRRWQARMTCYRRDGKSSRPNNH